MMSTYHRLSTLLSCTIAIFGAAALGGAPAFAEGKKADCSGLPSHDDLQQALIGAVEDTRANDTVGFGNDIVGEPRQPRRHRLRGRLQRR